MWKHSLLQHLFILGILFVCDASPKTIGATHTRLSGWQASDQCCDVDGETVGPCMKPCANAAEREANRAFKAHIQVSRWFRCGQQSYSSRSTIFNFDYFPNIMHCNHTTKNFSALVECLPYCF
jgi:hypothetical protein